MVKIFKEGISILDDKIIYRTDIDSSNDILNVVYPDIYSSEFLGNVYYFGYRFNDSSSRKDRTLIINWLKGINKNDCIDNNNLSKFIQKPLIELNKFINLSSFSAIIYPRSNRSDLTLQINKEIGNLTQHYTDKISYEIVKQLPENISFDWELFDFEYEGILNDNTYKQIKDYVNNNLMKKINILDYFSIARDVKPKYRRYIKDYLYFEDSKTEQYVRDIQKGKLLIVDVINTSGSTLKEILRIIRAINNECEIYIFTLIGKE